MPDLLKYVGKREINIPEWKSLFIEASRLIDVEWDKYLQGTRFKDSGDNSN